jgi:hypothetical protein
MLEIIIFLMRMKFGSAFKYNKNVCNILNTYKNVF